MKSKHRFWQHVANGSAGLPLTSLLIQLSQENRMLKCSRMASRLTNTKNTVKSKCHLSRQEGNLRPLLESSYTNLGVLCQNAFILNTLQRNGTWTQSNHLHDNLDTHDKLLYKGNRIVKESPIQTSNRFDILASMGDLQNDNYQHHMWHFSNIFQGQ